MRKTIACLITILIAVSSVSIALSKNAKANGPIIETASDQIQAETKGACGENLNWEYIDDFSTLEISGYGAMFDYSVDNPAPWVSFRDQIYTVRFRGGNANGAITSIGSFAFAYCINLEKVIMSGSRREIEHVGTYAFYSCDSLSDADNSLSVALAYSASFGTRAFARSGLTSFCVPPETDEISTGMFYECAALEYVHGCEGVTVIKEEAFCGCNALTSFEMPSGVTEIQPRAFMYCSNLSSVRTETSSIITIGESAFRECVSLTSFYMPDSLASIAPYTFFGDRSLQELYINRTISAIPEGAFEGCISLDKVHVPSNVQAIGEKAFANCASLTAVCLDDGVTTLKSFAFANCGITAMFFPTTITTVEASAFDGTPLVSLCVFSTKCDVDGAFCGSNPSPSLVVWGVAGSNIQEQLNANNIRTGTILPLETDIKSSSFYCLPANYICFRGFEGWQIDEPGFRPQSQMTRAMMVTMLWKIEGSPIVSEDNQPQFSDVKDDMYFKQSVDWAYSVGITCGTSKTTFSPDLTITREQAVTMLYRYAEVKALDISARADLAQYTDKSSIAKYAFVPFQWAVANFIIAGTSKTTLSPKHLNLRSEAVTIMYRFLYALTHLKVQAF